jgi:tetratricopeptide (TPR) repeat protein
MHWLLGNPETSRRAAEEGLQISLTIENQWAATYNYFALIAIAADAGQIEHAFALGELGAAGARAAGFPAFVGMLHTQLAQLYFETGQPAAGQEAASAAVRGFESMRAPLWTAMAHVVAGRAALERGALDEAWEHVRSLTMDSEDRQRDMEAVIFFGDEVLRVAFATGHLAEVLAFGEWFMPLMEREGALGIVGVFLYWSGRARAGQGDLDGAERDLARARELLSPAKSGRFLWRVDSALAEVYAARGDGERARQYRERAVALVEYIVAGMTDAGLRRRFLEHPDVVRVFKT